MKQAAFLRPAVTGQAGMTLIEVMVVVVIVAILAAIAYPSYREQVHKSRRSDARGTLVDTAQALERCYSSFGIYNSANCPVVTGGAVALNSPEGFYRVTSQTAAGAAALTATAFTLRAVPQGAQATDTDCAMLTLTNAGVRAARNSGGADQTARCW